ncbi:phosphomethylpyrimidine synthase [bacterium B17]|nr:phosphomethylpyrimidine synthase [bacterium B17]
MSTQIEYARGGQSTEAMKEVARTERVSVDKVIKDVAIGHAVIPANPKHLSLKPRIVGNEYTTKINANIGRSPERSSVDEETAKMQTALSAGADFVMDLSVGPELMKLRASLLDVCPVPFGTVPIYEALSRVGNNIKDLNEDVLLQVITEQAEQGVDFMTIHSGLLFAHIELAVKRVMGIASRGGAILADWMKINNCENPFYTGWDEIMDVCYENDVTVSLGDGLRPGCLADASDDAQFAELDVLGELVERCRDRNVQVMVEGPGHVPFNEIQMNMERQQKVCDYAPFYVLGPVVTDIAPGYDHITSCIGATEAAYHGASLLCYVTPAEHLGLPSDADVKDGVIAYRIAAHAADVAKKIPGAREIDDKMAQARSQFDWKRQFELAMDGETARARYEAARTGSDEDQDYCSMCGKDFCAVRTSKRVGDM